MIQSLLDIFKFEGWLPECRMSFCKGITQSGSNADTLLTDAYIKDITNVSWSEAFEAIRKDAEVEPFNWGVQGRGNIAEYNQLGYVPYDADYSHSRQDISHRTVSRSIEYAHNDFSIAMFARKMRNRAVYNEYIARASWWQNLWMEDAVESATKLRGFFQARYSNGSWVTNPRPGCETCLIAMTGQDHEFYEESAWSYSWFVPHDYAKLIELVGGRENFTERLGRSV
jgi:putative alpha-1,2-mannosidase